MIETNSSDAVREMVIAGLGISLRSTWDIGDELRSGAAGARAAAISRRQRCRPLCRLCQPGASCRSRRGCSSTISPSSTARPPYWDEGLPD
ncbi:MAG: hypothetical protein WDN24_06270 [Sphingomonas sp.]